MDETAVLLTEQVRARLLALPRRGDRVWAGDDPSSLAVVCVRGRAPVAELEVCRPGTDVALPRYGSHLPYSIWARRVAAATHAREGAER